MTTAMMMFIVHGDDHDGDGESDDVNDDGLHAGRRPEGQRESRGCREEDQGSRGGAQGCLMF